MEEGDQEEEVEVGATSGVVGIRESGGQEASRGGTRGAHRRGGRFDTLTGGFLRALGLVVWILEQLARLALRDFPLFFSFSPPALSFIFSLLPGHTHSIHHYCRARMRAEGEGGWGVWVVDVVRSKMRGCQ